MKIKRVGVDLAKNVFQVHGVDRHGKRVWKRQLRRSNWLEMLAERTDVDCEIWMEACAGAHHWARALQSRGYRVKLIPPRYVKPYVKSQKNDATDAEAICEAMRIYERSRPHLSFNRWLASRGGVHIRTYSSCPLGLERNDSFKTSNACSRRL